MTYIDFELLNGSMQNSTRLARVLVVVFGAYRSFDRTCESIARHVIAPNAPHVRVILSVDEEKPLLLSEQTGDCLAPFAHSLSILAERIQPSPKTSAPAEFRLIERALTFTRALNESFDFMVKVRTDLQANVAIPPMAQIYGEGRLVSSLSRSKRRERFDQFERAVRALYLAKAKRSPSAADTARAFILTAGIPEFLEPMLFHPSPSPWSMGDHEFLRKNVEDALRKIESTERTSFVRILRKIHQSHQIAYLIGSTWLNFGRYKDIERLSLDLLTLFGSLTWREHGFDDSEGNRVHGYVMRQQWRSVTESQLRLAHKKLNIELIDLINIHDYEKSFNGSDRSRLSVDNKDPTLMFYLLRDCTRGKFRAECDVYKRGRQPAVDSDVRYMKEQCDRISKEYGVTAGRTWGSAPERVRQLWTLVYRCDNIDTMVSWSNDKLKKCQQWIAEYGVQPGSSWGRLPSDLQKLWKSEYKCDNYLRLAA